MVTYCLWLYGKDLATFICLFIFSLASCDGSTLYYIVESVEVIRIKMSNNITNFREICMGNISRGMLFRGDYPVFNDKERDKIYDKLVAEAKIACVINLADNKAGLERIANLVPWYNILLRKNNVIGLDVQFDFNFKNKFEYEVFNYRLRQGFKFIINRNGPYLVHCNAGVDRTGFVSAIIELLLGASIDDVIYDYLLSYGKEFADAKNEEIIFITGRNIYGQINAVINEKIEDKNNLQINIEKYFFKEIGLTKKELDILKRKLSGTIFCD